MKTVEQGKWYFVCCVMSCHKKQRLSAYLSLAMTNKWDKHRRVNTSSVMCHCLCFLSVVAYLVWSLITSLSALRFTEPYRENLLEKTGASFLSYYSYLLKMKLLMEFVSEVRFMAFALLTSVASSFASSGCWRTQLLQTVKSCYFCAIFVIWDDDNIIYEVSLLLNHFKTRNRNL